MSEISCPFCQEKTQEEVCPQCKNILRKQTALTLKEIRSRSWKLYRSNIGFMLMIALGMALFLQCLFLYTTLGQILLTPVIRVPISVLGFVFAVCAALLTTFLFKNGKMSFLEFSLTIKSSFIKIIAVSFIILLSWAAIVIVCLTSITVIYRITGFENFSAWLLLLYVMVVLLYIYLRCMLFMPFMLALKPQNKIIDLIRASGSLTENKAGKTLVFLLYAGWPMVIVLCLQIVFYLLIYVEFLLWTIYDMTGINIYISHTVQQGLGIASFFVFFLWFPYMLLALSGFAIKLQADQDMERHTL